MRFEGWKNNAQVPLENLVLCLNGREFHVSYGEVIAWPWSLDSRKVRHSQVLQPEPKSGNFELKRIHVRLDCYKCYLKVGLRKKRG